MPAVWALVPCPHYTKTARRSHQSIPVAQLSKICARVVPDFVPDKTADFYKLMFAFKHGPIGTYNNKELIVLLLLLLARVAQARARLTRERAAHGVRRPWETGIFSCAGCARHKIRSGFTMARPLAQVRHPWHRSGRASVVNLPNICARVFRNDARMRLHCAHHVIYNR